MLFGTLYRVGVGPVAPLVPDPVSLDTRALALAAVASVLLFVLHRGIPATLAVCSALALAALAVGW